METVAEQPIRKFARPLTKKPEDSGYEIAGVLEFYYCRNSAAKNNANRNGPANKKKSNFFEFSRVFPGDQPLAKEPEDSEYENGLEIWSCPVQLWLRTLRICMELR